MRSWLAVLFVLILVIGLAIAISVGIFLWFGESVTVERDTIVEVILSGELQEMPSDNPFNQIFAPENLSAFEFWQLFDYAAKDDRVKGVYLEIRPLSMSWGQLEELRDAIHKFRATGKKVYAFLALDMVGEAEMYLASAADSITVNPDTWFALNGLVAEVTFYKRTLEKLQVKPFFIQFKEFKSPEVYERENLSEPVREVLTSILNDIEARFVATLVEDRAADETRVRELLNTGASLPREVLEANLIDRIGYRDDVSQVIRDEISRDYSSIGSKKYWEAIGSRAQGRSQFKVALVSGVGMITSGKSDSFAGILGGSSLSSTLREIRKDDAFKAVLLRVDSPGGSAVGSDMVWNEVRKLEEAGKPVIVSMSGVAGSGGYYISMGARHIVAQPSTITGSIGVIFGKFDAEGFFNWLGMDLDRVKSSPNADLFSMTSSPSPEQQAQFRSWIEEIYQQFVGKAAEGRGVSFDEMEPKARGRIYTGSQALEIDLVDQLGGFDAATSELRKALNLSEAQDLEIVLYPRPKTLWEALSEGEFPGVQTQPAAKSLQQWVEAQLRDLTTLSARLVMPELRIY